MNQSEFPCNWQVFFPIIAKVGSGERFGSEAGESDPFSDEDPDDIHDNDGDDEWEDVEEWQQVNSNHR